MAFLFESKDMTATAADHMFGRIACGAFRGKAERQGIDFEVGVLSPVTVGFRDLREAFVVASRTFEFS